jgi:hypothetical protein
LLVAWFLLFAVAWPLAVLVLLLAPLIWLVALPFRLVGVVFEALFALRVFWATAARSYRGQT